MELSKRRPLILPLFSTVNLELLLLRLFSVVYSLRAAGTPEISVSLQWNTQITLTRNREIALNPQINRPKGQAKKKQRIQHSNSIS